MYVHVRMYVWMDVCMCACVYVCVYVCMYICVYVFMYVLGMYRGQFFTKYRVLSIKGFFCRVWEPGIWQIRKIGRNV